MRSAIRVMAAAAAVLLVGPGVAAAEPSVLAPSPSAPGVVAPNAAERPSRIVATERHTPQQETVTVYSAAWQAFSAGQVPDLAAREAWIIRVNETLAAWQSAWESTRAVAASGG